MKNPFAMNVSYGQAYLTEDDPGLWFRHSALLDQIVEQLSSGTELCDKPNMAFGGDDFVQLRNMGMVELAVMVNLPRQSGGHIFRDLFDSNAAASKTMYPEPDRAVTSWRIVGSVTSIANASAARTFADNPS